MGSANASTSIGAKGSSERLVNHTGGQFTQVSGLRKLLGVGIASIEALEFEIGVNLKDSHSCSIDAGSMLRFGILVQIAVMISSFWTVRGESPPAPRNIGI